MHEVTQYFHLSLRVLVLILLAAVTSVAFSWEDVKQTFTVQLRQAPCAHGTELFMTFDESLDKFEAHAQFAYTIENSITFHGDIAEWRWRALEPSENLVWHYEANIEFPGSLPTPYTAAIHHYNLFDGPETSWRDIQRTLPAESTVVMIGNAFDIRAYMPPQLFQETGEGRVLQALLDEERTYEGLNGVSAPPLQVDEVGRVQAGEPFTVTGVTTQVELFYPLTLTARVDYEPPTACELGGGRQVFLRHYARARRSSQSDNLHG